MPEFVDAYAGSSSRFYSRQTGRSIVLSILGRDFFVPSFFNRRGAAKNISFKE